LTASANVAVAVTRSSELFLRCRGYPVEYLPSVAEDEWFDPRRRRAPRDTTGARVAYAGRLSRDKGTLELLQAARLLPQLEFFLMGELTDEIRSDVQSAPDNVISTGHLPRPEVMERLRTSDIFAFPSHREGCPNAVVEAMASGLPVVATRVGGLPEMIDEGRGGYLVEPGDSPALAQALARLAADPHLARRLGEHNRAVGRERFALSVVCRRLERIYEGVARGISEKGKQRNPRAPRLGLPSEKVDR
jgi:glycosyltransferase involved in cell wall biosynthesis